MLNPEYKTDNWFVDQLSLYQNANNDNASVKKNFVVRIADFELIISDLKQKKDKDPLQHELLLGRRGSGKSTLLRRIQIEVEEDSQLNKKYIAINLAEEQAGIYRLSDLWFETLQEISKQTNQTIQLALFSSFKNNTEYTRYLHEQINVLLKKANKKVVLLLDNIDRILESLYDDGNLLREMLLNHNNIQLIGGSTRMDEHFWRYDKPFYEFFRRHRLEGLSFEEVHLLLNQWSEAMNLTALKDYALHHRGKILTLLILTDGLPRTLQFFIQILLQDATLYGFEYIKKVMDKASPLYQERLNNLTPPQRKIVLEMAFIWEACSTKQLIEVCRMESKLIASFLKQLSSYGIVEVVQTPTKNHLYRLSERFFNMWLMVTQGNPDQKRKAKWLTIFLEAWYDAADIIDLLNKHLENIKNQKYQYHQAAVLTKALSQSRFISVIERDVLLRATNALNKSGQNTWNLPEMFIEILQKIVKLIDEKNYEKAIELVNGIENEEDGNKFLLLGYFNEEMGKFKEAERYYLLAIEKENIYALNDLANLYYNINKNKEKALDLIKEYNQKNRNEREKKLQIIIEVWNGIFECLEQKVKERVKNEEFVSEFIEELLYHQQTNLVQSLFEDEAIGNELKEKYLLLHYATLILNNQMADNLLLRIPPDVMPTVQAIVERVREKQAFYGAK